MQNSRLKENGKIDIFLESQRNDTSLYISNSNKWIMPMKKSTSHFDQSEKLKSLKNDFNLFNRPKLFTIGRL